MHRRFSSALSLGLLLAACGSAPAKTTEVTLSAASATAPASISSSAPKPPRGPSAAEIAQTLGHVRIIAVAEVALLRDHALADRFDPVIPYRTSLKLAGIDPRQEIDRILLADGSLTRHRNAMAIWEHHIDPARIDAFLTAAAEESEPTGHRTQIADHACAVLHRRRMIGTACVASPTILLVATDPDSAMLSALAGSRGIDHPPPGEAVHATFLDPSSTLAVGDFRPPSTLGTLEMGMRLTSPGGLEIGMRARSESPARDAADIEAMLTAPGAGFRIGPIPIAPPPMHFTAVGDQVVGNLSIARDDLDALMNVLAFALPL